MGLIQVIADPVEPRDKKLGHLTLTKFIVAITYCSFIDVILTFMVHIFLQGSLEKYCLTGVRFILNIVATMAAMASF